MQSRTKPLLSAIKTLLSRNTQAFFSKQPSNSSSQTFRQKMPARFIQVSAAAAGLTLYNAENSGKKPEEMYLAHIARSTGLSQQGEMKQIQDWFARLPESTQRLRIRSFMQARAALQTKPTYETAVINHLRASGCATPEILDIHAMIIEKALDSYYQAIFQNKTISGTTPLCFRELASKENVDSIITAYRKNCEIPDLDVDPKGNVRNTNRILAHGITSSPR